MSDRCPFYRLQLSRHADEVLPSVQLEDLESHLAVCSSCRNAQESDRTLRRMLREESRTLKLVDAVSFEENILAQMRCPEPKPASSIFAPLKYFRQLWGQGSFNFVAQMAGGTLAAATITFLCFTGTLHPAKDAKRAGYVESLPGAFSARNEPPVRLESLISTPSPRAAMLWTKPKGVHESSRPEIAPAPPAPEKKTDKSAGQDTPREHGSLNAPANIG